MDELYKAFVQIAGQQTLGTAQTTYALADVVADVAERLRSQLESAAPATAATKKTATQSSGTESPFTKVLKSAFGIAPIIGGLINLFSSQDEPPPLVKYALPPSVGFEAADTPGGFTSVDYDQTGQARAYRVRPDAAGPGSVRSTDATSPVPQITVNVQAMDARSFLDRSGDIALAVRDAMLNLNSINDVVNDL